MRRCPKEATAYSLALSRPANAKRIINQGALTLFLDAQTGMLVGLRSFEVAFSLQAKVPVWSWRITNHSPLEVRSFRSLDLDGACAGAEMADGWISAPRSLHAVETRRHSKFAAGWSDTYR